MAEKTNTQAFAFVRTGYEPRNIRHNERAVSGEPHHSQARRERRKWIVGNAGTGGAEARNQSGLANIGETYQPDVGEQLQFQPQIEHHAGSARFRFARGLVGGRGETRVSTSAASPLSSDHFQARRVKIPKFFAAGQVVNDRAHRERHGVIGAVLAVAV